MTLLAIETATELVGVAVGGPDGPDGPAASLSVTGRRRHAELLAPGITEVLAHAGTSLDALEAVAVDVGPGLFTGLRVGLATAKGLAQALGVGLVAVTSLEVLAAAASAGLTAQGAASTSVVAAVDARRGEVFGARYRARVPGAGGAPGGGGPVLEELSPPLRYTPDALAEELVHLAGLAHLGGDHQEAHPHPVLLTGDGARRYAGQLGTIDGVTLAGPFLDAPRPEVLLGLAAARLAAGEVPRPPGEVQARDLRDADVAINWVQRQGHHGDGR